MKHNTTTVKVLLSILLSIAWIAIILYVSAHTGYAELWANRLVSALNLHRSVEHSIGWSILVISFLPSSIALAYPFSIGIKANDMRDIPTLLLYILLIGIYIALSLVILSLYSLAVDAKIL